MRGMMEIWETNGGTNRRLVALVIGMAAAFHPRSLDAEEAGGVAGEKKLSPDLTEQIRAIFPGITIHPKERFVDVQSVVCLTEGYLEMIACAKDSREHESILMVDAKPSHIHAALLLIGARPGSPAISKPLNEEATRWIDIPPSGHEVKVTLLIPDEKGVMRERPVSDFVTHTKDGAGQTDAGGKADQFPDTFLFAGSITHQDGDTKTYLGDANGNVISISTFGDEVLCLSGHHARDNEALSWQIKPDSLPEIGTKATLRLRPLFIPPAKTE
jgi:hypothetical protein